MNGFIHHDLLAATLILWIFCATSITIMACIWIVEAVRAKLKDRTK